MSKKSRKRNKLLLAGAALFGASKLGMLGGKTAAGISGDKMASAKKAMTSNKTYSPSKFKKAIGPQKVNTPGITKVPESSLKKFSLKKDGSNPTRNMNSIFVNKETGAITKGNLKFKNKDIYSKYMKKKRGESTEGVKGFLNKFILGEKTKLNKGNMVKARGGGMARSKPTKLY